MIDALIPYYLHWYHSKPLGITTERRVELERLHRVLYRCAEHFSLNYKDYVGRYMPLSDKELQILEIQEQYPFLAGTWRPDYIITDDGSLKICEITSRFFAHGIFSSWYAEKAAGLFMSRFPGCSRTSRYPELLEYMWDILDGKRDIYVLKSADRTHEIRLYEEFYTSRGCSFKVLEAPEVEQSRSDWARPGVFLVSALNQADLLSFSTDTLRAMMDCGMYSDFRNIFLIHDKRFMSLWYEDAFTSACLTPEDTAFLREHAIPTISFMPCTSADSWLSELKENKDDYILKPYNLGKSEGVHAGVLTSAREWKKLLESPQGMVLQPFLKQRTYETRWEGKTYCDYICGMMLCVNDRYFGNGLFRCSSLPVTNVGDDRKACSIETDDPEILAHCDIL